MPRGAGRPRAPCVGGPAPPPYLPGRRLGDRTPPPLGPRVDRLGRRADAPGVRADVDDAAPAALDHARHQHACRPQGSLEVDVEDAVPERLLGLPEPLHLLPSPVVDGGGDPPRPPPRPPAPPRRPP